MMRRGASLTEATLELCRRFRLRSRVLPMSDQPVRTRCVTEQGSLTLQEYFVRERLQPALRALVFDGLENARPSTAVVSAVGGADLIVIGPSNPLLSIDPIIRLIHDHLPRAKTVAVTPIVGGVAIKGPTVEMMRALGVDPSPVEVARKYRDVCAGFVLDARDRGLAPAIEQLGYRVEVTETVMNDGGRRLAGELLGSSAVT
jgi:LPPG:FO 2-phospho-L-lactate transferase